MGARSKPATRKPRRLRDGRMSLVLVPGDPLPAGTYCYGYRITEVGYGAALQLIYEEPEEGTDD